MATDIKVTFNNGEWVQLHDIRTWSCFFGKLKVTGCKGTKYVYPLKNVAEYRVIPGTKKVIY